MSHTTPVVFVVDDDVSVRESLELMIRWLAAGDLRVRTGVPVSPTSSRSELSGSDVNLPDLNGLDLQKRVAVDRIDMPIIFHHGLRRRANDGPGDEGGSGRVLDEAIHDDVLLTSIGQAIERSHTVLESRGGDTDARATVTRHSAAANGRSWRWLSPAY
jgi:FixJ family two-component response regulator